MTDETRSPDPRMGLGGPSVGGTRGENESPREFNIRMRRADAERPRKEPGSLMTAIDRYEPRRRARRGSRGTLLVEQAQATRRGGR